jgi:hypothetical protein
MIELTVGQMFACMQPIMAISRQEMSMEWAEKIADFVGAYIDVMAPLEERATAMREIEYKSEDEKLEAFGDFAAEKVKLPEINFKEFNILRFTPDALATLKRAGLYT